MNSPARLQLRPLLVIGLLALAGANGAAQELEPGTYQNAPVGLDVVFASYGFSKGNILLDAALPVDGAHARVHALVLAYVRTLNLFGRSAKFDTQVPISWAHFEGFVAGEFRTRDPRGIADPRARLSVNLFGSPALDLRNFGGYRQKTIIGASLQASFPLGQYDADRLINLGANRWAFRPEVGISTAKGRWTFEGAGGAWMFTTNSDYFNGSKLAQKPLYFLKGSAIYAFRRNLWLSANYGRANGGETQLNDELQQDLQRNDRVGIVLSLPLTPAIALKVVYTSGLVTKLGADFDSIAFGYQHTFGLPKRPTK